MVDLAALPPTGKAIRAVRGEDGSYADLTVLQGASLRPYRRAIRMIFQDPYASLNPRKTVLQIVGESLRRHDDVRGPELERRVAELLRRVGLRPEYIRRYPHAFSGWRAAAHRGGARPRAAAAPGDRRRGGVRPRRVGAGADTQPAAGVAGRVRLYLPVRGPRPERGGLHQRPGRGDVRGQAGGGGQPRARVRDAEAPLHRGAAVGGAEPDPRLRSAGARIRLSATWPTRPTRPPAATSIPAAATSRTVAPRRRRRCATWATAIASPATSPRSCSWPASPACRPAINDNLSSDRESL